MAEKRNNGREAPADESEISAETERIFQAAGPDSLRLHCNGIQHIGSLLLPVYARGRQ